jgi:hypothetical protein
MPGNIQPLRWLFLTLAASMFITSPVYPWGSKVTTSSLLSPRLISPTLHANTSKSSPGGHTLADASTWPDTAGRQIPDMDPYHFINFPEAAPHTISSGIANCATVSHRGYRLVCADAQVPDAPRNEKRTARRFVAHLVGDIHQPLHAGFAEDRGGNSVDVRLNGRKENLHSL